MKSSDERRGRKLLLLILAAALGACSTGHDSFAADEIASTPDVPSASAANGPAADYPVVVGAPYTVDGTAYTPEDKLNYDQVGYLELDPKGAAGVSGEHHTLPLPSYVEVTSLETGRTILVRLERRGPMDSTKLIGLSQGALQQLGATPGTPVRVRRVNPPEEQRALLRAGKQAPLRIDTPMSLVNVLRRKLPDGGGGPVDLASANPARVPAPAANAAPVPQLATTSSTPAQPSIWPAAPKTGGTQPETATVASPAQQSFPGIATNKAEQPAPAMQAAQVPASHPASHSAPPPAAASARAAPSKGFVVQAGAFSSRKNATAVADAIHGSISHSGSLYRVRTGPFASRKEAEASLAKVHDAGYSDARIFWIG